MNKKLKEYSEQCEPATADQEMLDVLSREMDKAVPEIAEKIKQRQELAAVLRVAASSPSQSKKENPE